MMILRSAMLLAAAVTLSNCCLSPSSCNAPLAGSLTPAPAAALAPAAAPAPARAVAAASDEDGLYATESMGSESDSIEVRPARKQARRKADSVDAMSARSTSYRRDVGYEEQQALDQADEERLKQKLMICKNCSSAQ
ncbi:hypothetical protein ACQR1W_33075 [Bradyrhizobium sp. HKCCYLS1011]|uniref:hypothetical protein n=1 Tax=Bradyrhizobium sp. HKCCYLS1011 TaxID=3420733 RepID=UPI003EB97E97